MATSFFSYQTNFSQLLTPQTRVSSPECLRDTSCLQTSVQISNNTLLLCITGIYVLLFSLLLLWLAHLSQSSLLFPSLINHHYITCMQSNTVVFTALSPLDAIPLDKYQQLNTLGFTGFIRAQISAKLERCR